MEEVKNIAQHMTDSVRILMWIKRNSAGLKNGLNNKMCPRQVKSHVMLLNVAPHLPDWRRGKKELKAVCKIWWSLSQYKSMEKSSFGPHGIMMDPVIASALFQKAWSIQTLVWSQTWVTAMFTFSLLSCYLKQRCTALLFFISLCP